ncbi:hypothetical protein [Pseudanabaena sp. PCC 6802]|uniref:hypothetical protein n=1 Tax=Pseudanabaena sp. PCC 6802 TaxID=118173 RepID=UPI00034DDCE0|nr:hypothetical protein [Pseudanabaena sp. PCC 6802]
MTSATLIAGKVKYAAGKAKDYGHGDRINVVITAGGEEVKVWGKPDDAISLLKKGQDVQLIHDGKGYKLVETEASVEHQPSQLWTDEQKRAIALAVNQKADLLKYCLEVSKAKFVAVYSDDEPLETDDLLLVEAARDRYYVPDLNQQIDLDKLREQSLLKEFEEYRQSTQKLKIFRLEAIRAGFKKAWAEKDFRKIVDVARKHSSLEKIIQEDEKLLMFYDNALTRLGEA